MVLLALWAALSVVQWQLFDRFRAGTLLESLLVFGVVNFNILLLLLLLILTLRNLAKLAFESRRGVLGARLKTKLVLAFLAMTVIPTALLYLASAGFLARSIDSWFTGRVDTALQQALEVARTYYRVEEGRVLQHARRLAAELHDTRVMGEVGTEGDGSLPLATQDQLGAVTVFSVDGAVLKTVANPDLPRPRVPSASDPEVREALAGREASGLSRTEGGDFIRGAAPVFEPGTARLLGVVVVDGFIPGRILQRLHEITEGVEEYRQLEVLKSPIKVSYILPLLLVALLIVFAATWFGFYLARGITGPIQELAAATQRVAGGDLDFELETRRGDEVGMLVRSFNRMTRDLRASKVEVEEAQDSLRHTNEELDQRRRYMEIVLGRVATGVISTDRAGRISTINAAALEMLNLDAAVEGEFYRRVLPEKLEQVVTELLRDLRRSTHDSIQRQVVLTLSGARRTVMVNLTQLRDENGESLGAVAVFDDLTDLVRAQRAQAWQEVARRVAHEIKNPLTPIQLSAQRLRRRYRDLLGTEEGEVLDDATRTIVTQVDGLKRLVDEFRRFAKLPESRPEPGDLNRVVEEVVGLYHPAHTQIRFEVHLEAGLPSIEIDAEQVKRALINLLDNSVAALEGIEAPLIRVYTALDPDRQVVRTVVADNGPGLSSEASERLFEPYFSTKRGGTGLGLAIVKSIVADHKGYVRAASNKPRGTSIIVEFPLPGAVS